MREHIVKGKKTSSPVSIPVLKQPIRGFGLEQLNVSPPAVTEVQPISKPITHNISRIASHRPQTKLKINQPGDIYEQEADSIAQQVWLRMAQPLNRQSIEPQETPEEGQELLAHQLTPAVQRSPMLLDKGKGRWNFLAPIQKIIQPVIQRDIAVQIDVDIADMISDIVLAGTRPPGALDQTKEGSHTTAWIVTVEGVKNAVMGQQVDEAYTAIDKLFQTAQELPGTKRVSNLVAHKQQKYNTALQDAKTAQSNAKGKKDVNSLQMYIRAYLSYRNIIPLSAVDSGGNADGRGEGRVIGIIRDYSNYKNEVVKGAMLALFDAAAISKAVDDNLKSNIAERSANVPGMKKGDDAYNLNNEIMKQHIMSLNASFPKAFAYAFGDIKDYHKSGNLAKLFKQAEYTTAKGVLKEANLVDVEEPLKDQKAAVSPDAEPEEETFGTGKKTAAIQIELGTDNKIKNIFFGNRPHGLFGSKHGSHTTAWGVFTEGVLTAAKGKTINEAVSGIKALCDTALTLPGVARAQYLSAERKKAFEDAKRDVEETDTSNVTSLSDLQNYILTYLTFRNLVPMSAAMLGRAPGKGESGALDKLRNYQTVEASDLQLSVFKLLDAEAVIAIAQGSQKLPEKISGTHLLAADIQHNLEEYAIKKKLITHQELRKRLGKTNFPGSKVDPKQKAIAEAKKMIIKDVQALDKAIASEKDLTQKTVLKSRRDDLILKYLKDWYSPESDEQTHQRIPGAEGWGETEQENTPNDNGNSVEKSSKGALRLTEVVRQHLMSVKASFPDAYEKAAINKDVVKSQIALQRPSGVYSPETENLARIIDAVTGDDNLLQKCLAP